MSELYVLAMGEDDLDAIMEIEQASFSDPWTRDGFLESLKQPYAKMFVAKKDSKVVGYCCLYYILDEGEIINVAIHPDCRGKGYGKMMLEHLLKEGKCVGVKRFVLDVSVSNTPGQRLYESAGFKKIALQKKFYDTSVEDGWLMEYMV